MITLHVRKSTIKAIAVMCALAYNQLGNVIGVPFTLVLGQNSIDTAVQICLAVGSILVALSMVNRNAFIRNLLFICVACVLILSTKFLFPENYVYMEKEMYAIRMAMVAFLVISSVNNSQIILQGLRYAAYICMAYAVLIGMSISGIIDLPGFNTTYMVYGYSSLIAPVVFTYLYEKEHEKKYLAFIVICLLFILVFGSRGPMLYYLMFILAYNVLIKGVVSKKFIFWMLGLTVLYWIISNRMVMLFIRSIISDVFHFSSRSLDKLLDGSIANNSGRDLLYGPAIGIIKEKWLNGAGIYCDRALIYMQSEDSASMGYGHYVHNFFLEFTLDFGIPAMVIFVSFYTQTMRKILKNGDDDTIWAGILLTSLWLFESLTSGSFWKMQFFWGGLAFLFVFWEHFRMTKRTNKRVLY